jgi:hypothetical protein
LVAKLIIVNAELHDRYLKIVEAADDFEADNRRSLLPAKIVQLEHLNTVLQNELAEIMNVPAPSK